ncbi:MAG: ATP-binding protein [Frankiales bacterium]|nr:ATP-binding protein [Frankiales bacterium]
MRAELPGEPASVRRARSLVRGALSSWQLGALENDALLMVSELATNAVLHARSSFAVEATRVGRVVRVTVYDRSPTAPTPRLHSTTAGNGRGLAMVAELADSWGTARGQAPYTKGVWFEVTAQR